MYPWFNSSGVSGREVPGLLATCGGALCSEAACGEHLAPILGPNEGFNGWGWKVIGWNAAFFLPAKWTLFWTLNAASFPKMKENQVFFSCCNSNTAPKQFKGEWVCKWHALPGREGGRAGGSLVAGACRGDPSPASAPEISPFSFLQLWEGRPVPGWSSSSWLAPHRHSQRCVSRMPLIQSNWQSKFPIAVYNLIKLQCHFYPFSENFDTPDVIWFSPMHHLVGWMTVVGRKATL